MTIHSNSTTADLFPHRRPAGKALQVGDTVVLNKDVHLPAFPMTIPSGESADIKDIDPDDSSRLMLLLHRRCRQLGRCNLFPAKASQVRRVDAPTADVLKAWAVIDANWN